MRSMLSIITPVYNSVQFLNQSVNSILHQTYTDFELILIDDGSIDGSSDLCDSFANQDNRIQVIHQNNQGQAAARNRALDICRGDYVAFVDSDDYVHPRMFEYLIAMIEESGADVAVCSYEKGRQNNYTWHSVSNSYQLFPGKEFVRDSFIAQTGKSWLLWDKIYKRSCFDVIRLPEGRINEDNATVYKILYNTEKVADCDDVLYYYYTNESSTVNQKFKLKHLDYLLVLEEMIDFFTNHHEPELLDWANKSYLYSLADMYRKVHENCSEPSVEAELKRKLLAQYKQEKEKYPINMETYPSVIEVLKPTYAKLYWQSKALKQKLTGK